MRRIAATAGADVEDGGGRLREQVGQPAVDALEGDRLVAVGRELGVGVVPRYGVSHRPPALYGGGRVPIPRQVRQRDRATTVTGRRCHAGGARGQGMALRSRVGIPTIEP